MRYNTHEVITMHSWNPKQYEKFLKERTQPSIDLSNRIDNEPMSIIDIGCGPGNSTHVLKQRFSNAHILGIDTSEHMIQTAKKSHSNIDFEVRDAKDLMNTYDLIFSNACIQWIDNHQELLPYLYRHLNPNGILAIQIPMNQEEPIHQIIQRLVQGKWKEKITKPRIFYTLSESEYFDIASHLSNDFSLWTTTYMHRMPSLGSIVEWYKGTGLRPYLEQLNDDDQNIFIQDILRELEKAYPIQKNGEIIFRFPRLFMIIKNSPYAQ